MKALVLEEYKKLVYKDVPDPVVHENDVLLKVKACGICGSDVHGFDGSTGRRIPPLIMGHEASGEIVACGTGVKNWKPGDRVTFDSTVYQLDDWFTLEGHYNLSGNREVVGVSPGTYRRHGAFAEFISVPQHILYKIPDNVSFEQAAMTEAVAVALHAVGLSEIKVDDSVVVTGAGTIGTFILKLVKVAGAGTVVGIDSNESRLKDILAAGATAAYNSQTKDLVQKCLSSTRRGGFDISFEAVGKTESVNTAIDLTRKGGKCVLVGNLSPVVDFPLQKVVTGELRILGSCAIRGEYESVLSLLSSGKITVDGQISAVVPLSEGAEWFKRLYGKKEDLKKIILVP